MSRRDERDIARRLGDLPAGAPPPDLLARLQADVPPRVAIGEEPAARRRPAGAGRPAVRRWLLAASLAATVGAGLLAQRTMRHMEPLPALAGRPAAPAAAASPGAAPAGGEKAVPVAAPRLPRSRPAHPPPDVPRPSRRR